MGKYKKHIIDGDLVITEPDRFDRFIKNKSLVDRVFKRAAEEIGDSVSEEWKRLAGEVPPFNRTDESTGMLAKFRDGIKFEVIGGDSVEITSDGVVPFDILEGIRNKKGGNENIVLALTKPKGEEKSYYKKIRSETKGLPGVGKVSYKDNTVFVTVRPDTQWQHLHPGFPSDIAFDEAFEFTENSSLDIVNDIFDNYGFKIE